MKPLYDVPVIPNNLRHKETIIQIADALEYVNKVFDDILLRVNTRLNEKQKHVSKLKDRISVVHEKVGKLTQTKKATQVFSNSKYPMIKCNNKYKSIFNLEDHSEINFQRTKVKFKDPVVNDQIQNVLQFYHVKVKNDKDDMSGFGRSSLEGLGRFPANAQMINELLLFNTLKNPYKNYEMSDPLYHHLQENMKNIEESTNDGPDAAPLSMTQRLGAVRPSKEDYFYSPDMGEVPTIDVPLDLPDLPGVADDLRYLMELDPGIAPSVTTTPIIPELPSVIQSSIASTPTVQPPKTEFNNSSVSTSVPEALNELPDLPSTVEPVSMLPPVPYEMNNVDCDLPDIPESSILNQMTTTSPKPNTILPKTDVSAESRANLMEAIRQAGSLKKTQLNSVKKDPEPSKNQGVGNDLMADLHAKLALRRKGISGSKTTDGLAEVGSAMNRVSAMIPPPPVPSLDNPESTATEDEETEWDE